jgi:hypothetical protein
LAGKNRIVVMRSVSYALFGVIASSRPSPLTIGV